MKIQIINSGKIKVELTNDDLKKYDMNADSLKPDSPRLRKFLFYIMESVRVKTGFDPYNGQIMVEAEGTPAGVSLVISRVGQKRSISPAQKQRIRRAKPVLREKKSKAESGQIFSFGELKTLLAACRHLEKTDIEASSVYKYGKKYYMYIRPDAENARTRAVLSEFCEARGAGLYGISFMKEHGELVAGGDKLADICENIRFMNLL